MSNKLASKFQHIFKSKAFFRFVIFFFIFEASWIALTASYPQAFDENFHFGLIKVYSHYLLPFLTKQPDGANAYGAVARDPSFLYHYLMSFPYRLIELFTKSQIAQVIVLRFINIAFFASGLILFRKVLLKTKISKGLSNLFILLFSLIPVVPQLAGQVNYDNLLFPVVAGCCLLSFKLIDQIKAKQPQFKTYLGLIILCIFGSLVKYAFLPLFLAIDVFFLYIIIKNFGWNFKPLLNKLWLDIKKQSILTLVIFSGLFLILTSMFVERDVVNLVKYQAIAPSCSAVLSDQSCKAYSVWESDNSRHLALEKNLVPSPSKNPITYLAQWIYWMWYRLFFAINGLNSRFTNYPPLPLPSAIAAICGLVSLAALIKYRKKVFKSNPYVILLSLMAVFYIVALIIQGYSTYQFTAVLENMNGRYLLPVLFLIFAVAGRALIQLFINHRKLSILVACLVTLFFIEGGGIFTFIERSDPSWDFNNSSVVKVNNDVRKITSPVIIDGPKTYSTPVWFFN